MMIDYKCGDETNWLEVLRSVRPTPVERTEMFPAVDPIIQKYPRARVLDVGCGLGEWVMYYFRRGHKVIGVDHSRDVVLHNVERHKEHRFFCADADALFRYFAPEIADVVISWGVFEHVERGLSIPLEEAHYVLVPGGWLFFTVPFHNGRLSGASREKKEGERFYQYRFTVKEVEFWMRRAGFEVESVKPIGKAQGMKRMLLGVGVRGRWALRVLRVVLAPFFSREYVSHMLFCVGRK